MADQGDAAKMQRPRLGVVQRRLQYWVAGAALFQLLVQLLPVFGIGGPVGQMTGYANGPEVPAGWAFAIWSPLFTLATAFAIWQWGRTGRWVARVRPWAAGAMTASGLWMWMAQTLGADALTLPVIFAMLLCSFIGRLQAARRLIEVRHEPKASAPIIWTQRWLSAQSGWLSLACLLNVCAVARQSGIAADLAQINIALPLMVLMVGSLFAILMLCVLRHDLWYGGAVLWGLFGIIAANFGTTLEAANPPVLLPAIWAFICIALMLLWPRMAEGAFMLLAFVIGAALLGLGSYLQFGQGMTIIANNPVLIWPLLWLTLFAMAWFYFFALAPLPEDEQAA